MKRLFIFSSVFTLVFLPALAFAVSNDLILSPESVKFSTSAFLEGKTIRIYATATNAGNKDLRGVVKFFNGQDQIQGDQPVSVLADKDDSVFVDWLAEPGEHMIKAVLVPFDNEEDNPANNTVVKEITVFADTDRDGVPNKDDIDDDNDGVNDTEDAFPLNKNEQLDSDGDGIGNNKDEDDDNDGVPDSEDALPLNANETLDTDKDGIGNNEDSDDDGDGLLDMEETAKGTNPLNPDTDGDKVNDKEDAFPLDPTQTKDFDKDGISDEKDRDADNDGIPKEKDVNDTNLGPKIIITTAEKSAKKIVYPNEPVSFETTTSFDPDPDGKVVSTEWIIEGEKIAGEKLETKFATAGVRNVAVTLTDDKGEKRTQNFKIYVVSPILPWLAITVIFLIFILAIFLLFSYSKRRRSKLERIHGFLDTILRFLPKPKKK